MKLIILRNNEVAYVIREELTQYLLISSELILFYNNGLTTFQNFLLSQTFSPYVIEYSLLLCC